MKGLSFYICFGKWGKPRIDIDKQCFRIVLGFVAFAVLFYDLEMLLENAMKRINR